MKSELELPGLILRNEIRIQVRRPAGHLGVKGLACRASVARKPLESTPLEIFKYK